MIWMRKHSLLFALFCLFQAVYVPSAWAGLCGGPGKAFSYEKPTSLLSEDEIFEIAVVKRDGKLRDQLLANLNFPNSKQGRQKILGFENSRNLKTVTTEAFKYILGREGHVRRLVEI